MIQLWRPLRSAYSTGGESVGLAAKQQTFIREYLVDMNGTQAAIRAGYSPKTANEQASRLLANVNVKEALAEAWREKIKRADINADDVLRLITRAAFADIRDFVEWGRGDDQIQIKPSSEIDGQLVTEISEERKTFPDFTETNRKVKMVNKEAMIKLLAQHFGLADARVKLDVTTSLADVLGKAWAAEQGEDGDAKCPD